MHSFTCLGQVNFYGASSGTLLRTSPPLTLAKWRATPSQGQFQLLKPTHPSPSILIDALTCIHTHNYTLDTTQQLTFMIAHAELKLPLTHLLDFKLIYPGGKPYS